MKRIELLSLLLVLCMVVGVFASCGDDSTTNDLEQSASGSGLECEHKVVTDAAIEATCTTVGRTEGEYCEKCGEVLKAKEYVAAKGHSFENSTCKVCGAKESEGLYFEYDRSSDSYIVAGRGDCKDSNVIIPSTFDGKPVTKIKMHTFHNYNVEVTLLSVTIPDSVTVIDEWAFYTCTSLKSVVMGSGVETIGDKAFYDCLNLTSIMLPNGITEIGGAAFEGCTGLTSIVLPDSVTRVGQRAFYGCEKLTKVTLSNNIMRINSSTFGCCKELVDITIPDSVKYIREKAFSDCHKLESITIPSSVEEVSEKIFIGCKNLRNIYCGADSQPADWDADWNVDCNATVQWGS